MAARYLIRLDDACPTMRRDLWDALEDALDSTGVRPIVGVIPENRDPRFLCSSADPQFWERVRRWQRKGWGIAMHGLHHVYHANPKGSKPLLRLSRESEFVGVPLDQQRRMIRRASEIFAAEGVKPDLFMAPAHSFDTNTLRALEAESKIRLITDGHALAPYREAGFTWIPQQIWRLRPVPWGLWTVCLHPNAMDQGELKEVIAAFARHRTEIIDLASIDHRSVRPRGLSDRLVARFYPALLGLKRLL